MLHLDREGLGMKCSVQGCKSPLFALRIQIQRVLDLFKIGRIRLALINFLTVRRSWIPRSSQSLGLETVLQLIYFIRGEEQLEF